MTELLQTLRGLIGREVQYEGVLCQVIDVLVDGPALVLGRRGQRGVIQTDQYGDARRRVPQTYTVPLRSRIESDLHPVVRAFTDAREQAQLRRLLLG